MPTLLATDGSDYARRAAERAIEAAAEGDDQLYVLHVVDRRVHSEPGLGASELATITAEDHGHDCVAAVREMIAERGLDVQVEGVVRHGIPADLIREYAADVDADRIVVGEHGDHREHLGGVGRHLAAGCDCEVVVVGLDRSAETILPDA